MGWNGLEWVGMAHRMGWNGLEWPMESSRMIDDLSGGFQMEFQHSGWSPSESAGSHGGG